MDLLFHRSSDEFVLGTLGPSPFAIADYQVLVFCDLDQVGSDAIQLKLRDFENIPSEEILDDRYV